MSVLSWILIQQTEPKPRNLALRSEFVLEDGIGKKLRVGDCVMVRPFYLVRASLFFCRHSMHFEDKRVVLTPTKSC